MSAKQLSQSHRGIRLSKSGRKVIKVALIFIVPGLLGALWLMIDIPRQIMRRNDLRREGIETAAKIEKLTYARGSQLWVKYSFVVEGRPILNEVRVPESFDASLSHAGSLTIRYIPSDPGVNYPDEWEWTIYSEGGWIVAFAWSVPGFLFLRRLRRGRQLAAQGAVAVGVVTNCSSDKGGYQIAYEFRTPKGTAIEGSGRSLYAKRIGDSVDVLFLPEDPLRAEVLPLQDYEITDGSDWAGRLEGGPGLDNRSQKG